MKERILSFLREEEGLTMVEYAVAGALITIGAVAAFTTLGTAIQTTLADITTAVLAR